MRSLLWNSGQEISGSGILWPTPDFHYAHFSSFSANGRYKGMPSFSMLIEQTTCETWAIPGGRQVQGLARGSSPLRIAIFDYKITRNNPTGSCHLAMLRALAAEHDFTVFAVEFENPCPEKIRFVRVPSPTRPLALLFLVYHFMAPLCYSALPAARRRKARSRPVAREQSRLQQHSLLSLLPRHVPQAPLE